MLRWPLRISSAAMMTKATTSDARGAPSFGEAFRFWLKLGFISFGGPAGQFAIMQTELVERRRWSSQSRFLHALNFCMLLPGPEAQQLAIYIGWLLHRTSGGIIAGTFFVLPSIFVLLTLSYIYAAYGHLPFVIGLLNGFKPVVVAIVVEAVLKVGKRALRHRIHFLIASAAFIAIYFFHVSFPLIVLAAAATGFLSESKQNARGILTEESSKSGQPAMSSAINHRETLTSESDLSINLINDNVPLH